MNWAGPVLAQPCGWADVVAYNNKVGLSPAALAGLMF